MVIPSLLSRYNICQNSRLDTGSTPVVGSSRKKSFGLCISPAANAKPAAEAISPRRRLSPKKLLHSKWTAVVPHNKEKHFIVTQVIVPVGTRVEAGALLIVMEAMKMEHQISAPVAGQVTAVHARVGDPGESIAKEAADQGCDLIVMGTHGAGMTAALLGSVAQAALGAAKVPVLLVK